jgi:hypothetical protein
MLSADPHLIGDRFLILQLCRETGIDGGAHGFTPR